MIDLALAAVTFIAGGSAVIISSLKFARWSIERQDRLDRQSEEPVILSKEMQLNANTISRYRSHWMEVFNDNCQPERVRQQARVRIEELDKRLMRLEDGK